jgi:hypothetical protein
MKAIEQVKEFGLESSFRTEQLKWWCGNWSFSDVEDHDYTHDDSVHVYDDFERRAGN